ncbi:solute carrier family 17 (sodium-dependent inorganic phosphate cotransporter)-like isoform X2 [Nasonia vitripennis]|uniref:Major facilitator superfamily (MFS) profile domain-containing protein n=1 Tax=Nasonia vitripennis TaxID=7425 RepID=A0A7M7QEN7_NASVI|nr:solute carrier family 17 (sodium-dependent inorganic phosphate cotransporter)-like isoform X2 [Nasonia vitripennis]
MIRIYNSVSIRNQLLSRSHIGASTLQKFASIMEDSKISEASKETIAVDAYSSPCGNDGKGSCMFRHKRRYLVAVLAFFGFFISYILRVNLSIAIVKMTSNRTMTDEHGELRRYGQEFDWDTKLQGLILSSFFYGYMSTQLLGGWMASRIGGKRVFGFGIAVTAFFTILTPPITRHSVYLFIAVRVIEGICEGVTYPCIHAIWANWAPPLERSKLATLAFSGSFVGTVFAMPVCGMMAERLGWPSIFYVFGALGLVWYVCWCVVVKDRPEDDPYISDFELKYIKRMLGPAEHRRISHPWKAIISSPAVWAIIAAHFSENWGFYTMLTQLPTFMNGKTIENSISRRPEFQTRKNGLPLRTPLPSDGNSPANFGPPGRLPALEENFNDDPGAQALELRSVFEPNDFHDLHGLHPNADRSRRVHHRRRGSRRICMVWIQRQLPGYSAEAGERDNGNRQHVRDSAGDH